MAVSGLCLLLFVIGHMLGNLQFFLGPEPINAYANFLQSTPELLWGVRLGMLFMVGLHIWSATSLTLENRAARPVSYDRTHLVAASYASRTMMVSGCIIAAFIIYHLLHYTVQLQAINLTGQDFRVLHDEKHHHDVYRMMILGFSKPLVSLFYLVAVSLLCLHLSHGVGAMFQSLGLKNRTWGAILDRAGMVIGWVLLLGYASIPLAILCGYGS